jgi:hypothetical protein
LRQADLLIVLMDRGTAQIALVLVLSLAGLVIAIFARSRRRGPETGHDRAARREEDWYGHLVGYRPQGMSGAERVILRWLERHAWIGAAAFAIITVIGLAPKTETTG